MLPSFPAPVLEETHQDPPGFTASGLLNPVVSLVMAILSSQSSAIEFVELTPDAPSMIAEARELLPESGRFVASQRSVARFCFGSLEKEVERLPVSY